MLAAVDLRKLHTGFNIDAFCLEVSLLHPQEGVGWWKQFAFFCVKSMQIHVMHHSGGKYFQSTIPSGPEYLTVKLYWKGQI